MQTRQTLRIKRDIPIRTELSTLTQLRNFYRFHGSGSLLISNILNIKEENFQVLPGK